MPIKKKPVEISTININTGRATFYILGQSPLVYAAMSQKVIQELIWPGGPKTKAERATTLKHNPIEEFRDSTYRRRDSEKGPTRFLLKASMFKAALADVALRVPGATKTEMKQLVWVEDDHGGDYIDVYGVPQIGSFIVRNQGMNRTPDVHTKAVLPEWCCKINIRYTIPHLSADTVGSLLGYAGFLNGVGDFRPQRGGNHGKWEPVGEDNKQFAALVKNGGMAAQDRAMKKPGAFDLETETLLKWFDDKLAKTDRGTTTKKEIHSRKRNSAGVGVNAGDAGIPA